MASGMKTHSSKSWWQEPMSQMYGTAHAELKDPTTDHVAGHEWRHSPRVLPPRLQQNSKYREGLSIPLMFVLDDWTESVDISVRA